MKLSSDVGGSIDSSFANEAANSARVSFKVASVLA